MSHVPRLYVIDDDPGVLGFLRTIGGSAGFDVSGFERPHDALAAIERDAPDAAMVDLRMPVMGGLTVLREIRRTAPACTVLLMTAHGNIESAVEAVRHGATDYLTKPFDFAYLRGRLDALRSEIDRRQHPHRSRRVPRIAGMIGESAPMLALYDLIHRAAPHLTMALVTGETGTGKELVARALHMLGPRRQRAFIPINCSAIVETLFESELFGHTRGAFTGAHESRPGLFEQAHGGIIFLDEVGELPAAMQAKLLRVLETGEVATVGSREARRVDVHVIAATNRPLERDVEQQRFRADLFYRLNGLELAVPPLRERLEDLPLLARHFVREWSRRFGHPDRLVSDAALARLARWRWPGNVRELRSVLERACMLADGDSIDVNDLRLSPRADESASDTTSRVRPIAELERTEIARALAETGGNKKESARRLGISRRALYRRLEKLNADS